jgi:hypothetical protein
MVNDNHSLATCGGHDEGGEGSQSPKQLRQLEVTVNSASGWNRDLKLQVEAQAATVIGQCADQMMPAPASES